jgi:hypothetical protein
MTKGTIAGSLKELPTETEFRISGGIEAYFGIFGVFNVRGAWSFADVLHQTRTRTVSRLRGRRKVIFNHLECSGGQLTTGQLRADLLGGGHEHARAADGDGCGETDDSVTQALQRLREPRRPSTPSGAGSPSMAT